MNVCRSQPPHQLCKTSSLTATANQQLEGEEHLWAPPKPHPQKTVTICLVWLLPGKTPFTGLVFICPDSMRSVWVCQKQPVVLFNNAAACGGDNQLGQTRGWPKISKALRRPWVLTSG